MLKAKTAHDNRKVHIKGQAIERERDKKYLSTTIKVPKE